MKNKAFYLLVLLLLSASLVTAQSFQASIQKFNQGAVAYGEDNLEEAKGHFAEAIDGFEAILAAGMEDLSTQAYSKTYLATSYYYTGIIDRSSDLLSQASDMFQEARLDMTREGIYDENYVSSLFYRAMCSFRQYQISGAENAQANFLQSALGDFQVFLDDSVVQAEAESYEERIGYANYLSGYSLYRYGIINTYNPGRMTQARRAFNDALAYFKKAQDANDARLASVSILMEGECHYRLARLFGAVNPEDWDDANLSDEGRSEAIVGQIDRATTAVDRMVSTAGAHVDLRNYGRMSGYCNYVYARSAGKDERFNEILIELRDLDLGATFTRQKDIRIADAHLGNFLVYTGNIRAAKGPLGGLAREYPLSNYWIGWLDFIDNEFNQASAAFDRYIANAGSPRTRLDNIANADARFRSLECRFWYAVQARPDQRLTLLRGLGDQYTGIADNQYLTQDARNIANLRVALIRIEQFLSEDQSREYFLNILRREGQDTPDRLLPIARYFVEKGIGVTGGESRTALQLAGFALDRINELSSDAALKNQATFIKGVSLVKYATTYPDAQVAERNRYLQEARTVLGQCRAPYKDEADYVIGISHWIAEENSQANSKFDPLIQRGHMRAAFYKGLMAADCVSRGTIWAKIEASTPADMPIHARARNAKNMLDCAAQIPRQQPYPSLMSDPPMTYENLVDEEADRQLKMAEANFMWQMISSGKIIPDVDMLISDTPPETNVEVRFVINPRGGTEDLLINGSAEEVRQDGESEYRATIMRGRTNISVTKRGYYYYIQDYDINRSTTIEINLDRAVRYSEGSAITRAESPMAIASRGENVFVANNRDRQIMHFGPDGSVKGRIDYSDLGVVTVTALAVSDDLLLFADSRHNVVKVSDFSGENVDYVAFGNEPYEGKKLNNPSGIAASAGNYYIVDSSNGRVLRFEGGIFRSSFGQGDLVKPIDVVVVPEEERIYVTDVVKGAVCIFDFGGVLVDEKQLTSIETPSYIFRDGDGYFYVADFTTNTVSKFTRNLELLSKASDDLPSPRGVTLVGLGPEATMFVPTRNNVSVLRGAWDNHYLPE